MQWRWLGMLTLVTCGAEPIEVAELGEVCGAASPFRVLELPPNQQLVSQRHLGDRVLHVVGTRVTQPALDLFFPSTTSTTLWSTGPCGESPIQLAANLSLLAPVEAWPGVALACDEATGDVLSIDPTGQQPPHVVFADVPHAHGCGIRWTPHGLLSIAADDDKQGALLLHPYPTDPFKDTSEPIVLLDPIRINGSGSGSSLIGDVLRALDDHVLALTPDNTLVRVELADRAIRELRTGVIAFDASPQTGRYILWQDEKLTPTEVQGNPEGQLYLRDQNFASDIPLLQESLAYGGSMSFAEQGAIEISLGFVDLHPKRVVFIPGLDHVDLSQSLFLNALLDDGRWIVSWWNGAYYDIVDLRTGESRRLADGPVQMIALNAASADFLAAPPCCSDGDNRDEGSVWRINLDASPARRLAPRATAFMRRLADQRIVTPINIDEQWLADLIIIDPDTQAEHKLDDHVYTTSTRIGWGDDPDVISYSIADGERSGIYIARLPPRETPRELPQPRPDARVLDLLPDQDGRLVPHPRRLTDMPGPHPSRE